jgi:hypothetical protein
VGDILPGVFPGQNQGGFSVKALRPKQADFVREYLIDLNATQAAIRAGYSSKTAAFIGHENLRKPQIMEALAAERSRQAKRTELTADMVIHGLLKEATNEDPNTASARVRAWDLLGKHLGIFGADNKQRGGVGVIVLRPPLIEKPPDAGVYITDDAGSPDDNDEDQDGGDE